MVVIAIGHSRDDQSAFRSVSMFCAAMGMCNACEICVFSPARRASRKLLERIHEFVVLAGFADSILEYNQEQLRLTSVDGGTSLVRSFPSRVAVCALAQIVS